MEAKQAFSPSIIVTSGRFWPAFSYHHSSINYTSNERDGSIKEQVFSMLVIAFYTTVAL